jgi:1-acyl-sn-glycerol-3-phosphate acyltransferase
MLPFHANLFQAAISAEAPVQPVALSYVDTASGRMSFAAGYVGDDTLVASLWRTLTAPPFAAVVAFGEPQQAHGRDRRAWAAALRDTVIGLRGL